MDRVFDTLGELQRQAIGQYLLTSAQIKLGTLQDRIHQYEHAVTTLYDYLSAISTQTVTPAVLTPHQLRIVLRRVKEHIVNQPKLALPGDPDAYVWSYYGYICAIPAIVGQTLLVSLQIPLADVSTTLRFYRIHSFPLLDPHTQQQFSYELENPYLAVDAKTDYYTLPAEAEVSLCVATRGKWCLLAQPMYTMDTSCHCVLALFLKQNALIAKFCTIIHHRSTGVYAAQLQPCIWVVSLARSMLLRTECVTTRRDQRVLEPLYSLVSLPQTCYAHIGDSLFLPASTELSLTVNKTLISTYPHLAFHAQYHPMSTFRLFKGLNKTVDPEEVQALTTKLLEYDKLPMPQMTEKLCQLDYNYPKPFGIAEFFKSKYFIIGVVVIIVLLLLVGIGVACWKFQAFRMFCFSFCRHKEKSQKSLPVPQPRLLRPTSAIEGGASRKRSSSSSSSSTESAGKGQRAPPAFGRVSIHRSGQTSIYSSDSDTSRAVLNPLDLTAHYSTLPRTQPLFQRTPSERIRLAETDRARLEALEKFSTLADIKLKEKERQHYSSARSAQL